MHRSLMILLLAAAPAWAEVANPLQPSATWDEIAGDVVGDVTPGPADGILDLDAPVRAEDAAIVPVRLVQPEGAPAVTNLTLVIDENPAPVAAEMVVGEAMLPLDFELRVRVNQYSDVRAIATTLAGDVVMAGRYVKASGGCSAPATGSVDEQLAGMGEMRLRGFGQAEDGRQEAQIMIRHPMFSGLQRDQLTQLTVPAHFIHRLDVYQGEELLFSINGGISISENPVFRFRYTDNGAPGFTVRAEDTDGNVFEQTMPKAEG